MQVNFDSKSALVDWLKKSTSLALLSISLCGGVHEFYVQASSISALAQVAESNAEYFPEGAYKVSYEQGDEDDSQDVSFDNVLIAFTFQARSAQHPEVEIGGMIELTKNLSDFEYVAKVQRGDNGIFNGHLEVAMPAEPGDLERLIEIVKSYSICFVTPDGNLRFGNGLRV